MVPASELYIQNRQFNMTPQEYIEKLVELQCNLASVKYDLDFAIYRIQRRKETGDESMERDVRWIVLAGRESARAIVDKLQDIGTAKIEY